MAVVRDEPVAAVLLGLGLAVLAARDVWALVRGLDLDLEAGMGLGEARDGCDENGAPRTERE